MGKKEPDNLHVTCPCCQAKLVVDAVFNRDYQVVQGVVLVTASAYILLNLLFSTQAAYAAPIIMMSQNRQTERDRFEAAKDYEVNLKAELEVLSLHQKIDMQVLTELSVVKEEIAKLSKLMTEKNGANG